MAPPLPSSSPGFAICCSAPLWVSLRRTTITLLPPPLRFHLSKPRRSWAKVLARGRWRKPSRAPHCTSETASDSPSRPPHDGTSHSFIRNMAVWCFSKWDPSYQSKMVLSTVLHGTRTLEILRQMFPTLCNLFINVLENICICVQHCVVIHVCRSCMVGLGQSFYISSCVTRCQWFAFSPPNLISLQSEKTKQKKNTWTWLWTRISTQLLFTLRRRQIHVFE